MDVQKSPWKSLLFVAVQFLSLGVIGLTGPIFAENGWYFTLEIAGLALGVWAVLIMRPGNFNITPDPLKRSQLVKVGPYRFIRHPMYLALLLTTFPLILDSFSVIRLLFWIILLADLVLKIQYEEKLLIAGVANYELYIKESYRILPFIC